jgi:D-alanyl-D-alanine carboxypeptidase
MNRELLLLMPFFFVFTFCSKSAETPLKADTPLAAGEKPASEENAPSQAPVIQDEREAFIDDFWRWAFGDAGLPSELSRKVAESATEGPDFIMELLTVLEEDPYLYILVDKTHPLPDGYNPGDLVELKTGSYAVTRNGLMLRKAAAAALEEMAAAALAEGITLTAGSAYRSYEYQVEVYNRNVSEMGREAADRESARSGHSQHQLGLVVDFSPIDDSFAQTPAGRWVLSNAGRFGWSISFPDGFEAATGYRWESWHYRYVGKDLALFINTYFDGVQQYALQFIHGWIQNSDGEASSVP